MLLSTACADVPPLDAKSQKRLSSDVNTRGPEPDPALQPTPRSELDRRVATWARWLDSPEEALFIDGKTGLLRFPQRASLHFEGSFMPKTLQGRSAAYEIIMRWLFLEQQAEAESAQQDPSADPAESSDAAQAGAKGKREAPSDASTEEESVAAILIGGREPYVEPMPEKEAEVAEWLRFKLTEELFAESANADQDAPSDPATPAEDSAASQQRSANALTSLKLQSLSWIERLDNSHFLATGQTRDQSPIIRALGASQWELRRAAGDYLTSHAYWLNKADLEEIARYLDSDDLDLRIDASSTILRLYRSLARGSANGQGQAPLTYNPMATLSARQQQTSRIREWIETRGEAALQRAKQGAEKARKSNQKQ